MGAYENPQIIAQPDYGAIFRNNMQASYEQTNAIFERARARREKMEAEADQRLAMVLNFDQAVGKVGGGDLEKSLQRTGMILKDEYVNLIRNKKNMPREDYDNGVISVMRKLDELKGVGGILTQQSKELEKSDISEFQENGDNYHTLLSKWKSQEIKFQYVGDELEIYFNDNEGNKRIVDITALKDEKFMNLNEKYNLTTTQMKNLVSGVQVVDTYIDRKTGNKTQGYAGGLNEQQIIDNTANSDQMKEHFDEVEDAGSIFKDNVFKKTNKATLTSLADKISLNNNLTAEQKAEFKKLITSGSYDDIKFKDEDGVEISYRSLVDEVSRQKLATEAFQQYAPKLGKVTFTGEAGNNTPKNEDERRRLGYSNIIQSISKNATPIQLLNRVNQSSDFSAQFGYKTGQKLTSIGDKKDVLNYLNNLKTSKENRALKNNIEEQLEKFKDNDVFDMNDLDENNKLTKLNSKDTLAKIFEESPMFKKNDGMYIRNYMTTFEFGKNTINGKDYSKPSNSANPKMGR